MRVKALGLNHAEAFFRKGIWGDVAQVSGIECVGEVHDPGESKLRQDQRVFALMGGMGRSINGSYAEYTAVPEGHVIPIESSMSWTDLAAIPESYATAWTFLLHNLEAKSGQVIVVRGGTSALGQAAINLARDREIRVLATTRSAQKAHILEELGAEPLIETPDLSAEVRRRIPHGVDGVIEIVGTSTLLDSFKMVRYRGRVAMAGFLGGGVVALEWILLGEVLAVGCTRQRRLVVGGPHCCSHELQILQELSDAITLDLAGHWLGVWLLVV